VNFAYGRLAPTPTPRRAASVFAFAAALDPLGAPPSESNDYRSAVKVPWGVYQNDVLGCCVPADTAHAIMLRTANASRIVVPSVADVLGLYEIVGGYVPGRPDTDRGCEESVMCDYMMNPGFLGHRAEAVGNVDHLNHDHLRWCVQLFGTCRLGLNLPKYAEDQFELGHPWDVSDNGDQSTSGHDVPLVWYGGGVFKCVTWGQTQVLTPAFVAKYCEESHAELFPDWIRSQGEAPPGLDLVTLSSRLRALVD
jgi:hypothetical protein